MTTNRVGNVSKVTPVNTNGNAKGASVDATGFQKIWNSQADRDNRQQITDASSKSGKNQQNSLTKNSLNHKKIQQTNTPTSNKKVEESDVTDIQKAQQVLEILQMISGQLLQQLSDTLNVSADDVQQAMDELGMSPMDLLNQDKLGQLLLNLNGIEDSMALLTDEQLYQQYQDAMKLREDVVNTLTEDFGLDESAVQKAQMAQQGQIEVQEQPDALTPEEENGENRDYSASEIGEGQTRPETQEGLSEMSRSDGEKSQTSEHGKDTQKDTPNLVLQSMKETTFTQHTEQASEQATLQKPDTQDIMRQIMDYMKVQIKPGISNLEMQLHPASLGTLQIQVASKGGVLTAQFITQNESVKAALESQMIQLKENFAEQGIQVEAIEVTVQTHQFEQNLEQGRGKQQDQSSQAPRVRRTLRLDAISDMDYADEMDAEDQLTMEMMEANGTTVDFTA